MTWRELSSLHHGLWASHCDKSAASPNQHCWYSGENVLFLAKRNTSLACCLYTLFDNNRCEPMGNVLLRLGTGSAEVTGSKSLSGVVAGFKCLRCFCLYKNTFLLRRCQCVTWACCFGHPEKVRTCHTSEVSEDKNREKITFNYFRINNKQMFLVDGMTPKLFHYRE